MRKVLCAAVLAVLIWTSLVFVTSHVQAADAQWRKEAVLGQAFLFSESQSYSSTDSWEFVYLGIDGSGTLHILLASRDYSKKLVPIAQLCVPGQPGKETAFTIASPSGERFALVVEPSADRLRVVSVNRPSEALAPPTSVTTAKAGAAAPSGEAFPLTGVTTWIVTDRKTGARLGIALKGEITNRSGRAYSSVGFNVILRGADGGVTGSTTLRLYDFREGATKPFEVTVYGADPDLTTSYAIEFDSGR